MINLFVSTENINGEFNHGLNILLKSFDLISL